MESFKNKTEESGSLLIKNEKGIFVEPDHLLAKKENINKEAKRIIDNYNEKRAKDENAPTPNITVPFTVVVTRALPPKMVNALSHLGLHYEKLDVEERFLEQLKLMNANVSDEQEILLVGDMVNEVFQPGKIAKLNFQRYRTIRDNSDGVINTAYDIPSYEIEGVKYLFMDQRDIIWVSDKK